jgi:hypothetical protein
VHGFFVPTTSTEEHSAAEVLDQALSDGLVTKLNSASQAMEVLPWFQPAWVWAWLQGQSCSRDRPSSVAAARKGV